MNPLSGVLGEAWTLYKRHASHFLLIAFAIYLVVAVITALLSLALGSFGAVLGGLLSLLGTFLLQAALVKAVQDARDGRDELDLRGCVNAALPFHSRCRTRPGPSSPTWWWAPWSPRSSPRW